MSLKKQMKFFNSKLNISYLLDDESDAEDNLDVNWEIKSDKDVDEKTDETDDYYNYKDDDNITENISPPKDKKTSKLSEPEINIEIKEDDNKEYCVQFTIKMEIDNGKKDLITIDFTINKTTFLKIAKELK